ncbi:MAG: cysteine desulfurase [Watsoniomyces obsoletus]|nr:MAG: cysteine desulfurase [Watsoniomyces obsoletus]
MATPVAPKVLEWLYNVLAGEYQAASRTYNDTVRALSEYSTLSPRTDVYTNEVGVSALLLHLSGILPVDFRGSLYHFPISVWIPHAYPREAPFVYVTPAQGMMIRPGQHVSGEGRVYHPYLAGWREFWDKSNIADLLSILRDVFAKEPPVVAVQQQQPQTEASRMSARSSIEVPPVPPLPRELDRRRGSDHDAPPPPPKPYDGRGSQQSQYRESPPPLPVKGGPSSQQLPGTMSYDNRPNERMMAYDGIAHGHGFPPPALPNTSNQPFEARHSTSPAGNALPHHQSPLPGPPLPPLPVPQSLQRPSPQPQTYRSPPMLPPLHPNYPTQSPPPMPNPHNQATIPTYPPFPQAPKPKQPIIDLLSTPLPVLSPSSSSSSSNLPAPPIPPNPQKDHLLRTIASKLHSHRQQSHLQLHSHTLPALRSQHEAMLRSLSSIQAELDQLTNLETTLSTNERILNEAMRDADAVIKDANSRTDLPGVDELLVAPTVVGQQLYKTIAEERALEDVGYVLAKALDRGRIGLDAYLKQMRHLARERFWRMALVEKIGRGMGLDMN